MRMYTYVFQLPTFSHTHTRTHTHTHTHTRTHTRKCAYVYVCIPTPHILMGAAVSIKEIHLCTIYVFQSRVFVRIHNTVGRIDTFCVYFYVCTLTPCILMNHCVFYVCACTLTPCVVMHAAAGAYHSVAVSDRGDVYTFGSNRNGQLGKAQADLQVSVSLLTVRYLHAQTHRLLCIESITSTQRTREDLSLHRHTDYFVL